MSASTPTPEAGQDERGVTVRPNGKVYRRRKAPVLVVLDDHRGDMYVVLRTHDRAEADDVAREQLMAEYGEVWEPTPCWVRERVCFHDGEHASDFEDDPVRGVPAMAYAQ